MKEEHKNFATLKKLAHRQLEAVAAVEQAERDLEQRKSELREVEEVLIPDTMDTLGLMHYTTDDGLRISVVQVIRANISKARKAEALAWLRAHGHDKLIKHVFSVIASDEEEVEALQEQLSGYDVRDDSSVRAQTLTSFVKGMLERGEEVPMDLFGVFAQRTSKITIALT